MLQLQEIAMKLRYYINVHASDTAVGYVGGVLLIDQI